MKHPKKPPEAESTEYEELAKRLERRSMSPLHGEELTEAAAAIRTLTARCEVLKAAMREAKEFVVDAHFNAVQASEHPDPVPDWLRARLRAGIASNAAKAILALDTTDSSVKNPNGTP